MSPPDSLLPAGVEETVPSGPKDDSDIIAEIKDDLQTTQSALEKEKEKNKGLESEIKVLRDNTKIKIDAVFYAKVFMVIIPVFCLALLIASTIDWPLVTGIQGISKIEIDGYAQAALVIAPILFVATVLGFLLRGVLGSPGKGEELDLAKLGTKLGDKG